MSQPPVKHPIRPGVYGVFLPAELLARHEGPEWITRLKRSALPEWERHILSLKPWMIDFCREHEMDPLRRPIQIHELEDRPGYGVFYQEEP